MKKILLGLVVLSSISTVALANDFRVACASMYATGSPGESIQSQIDAFSKTLSEKAISMSAPTLGKAQVCTTVELGANTIQTTSIFQVLCTDVYADGGIDAVVAQAATKLAKPLKRLSAPALNMEDFFICATGEFGS